MTLSRRLLCMTNVALLSASVYATAPDFSDAGSETAHVSVSVHWANTLKAIGLAMVGSGGAYMVMDEINRRMDMGIENPYLTSVSAIVAAAVLYSGDVFASTPSQQGVNKLAALGVTDASPSGKYATVNVKQKLQALERATGFFSDRKNREIEHVELLEIARILNESVAFLQGRKDHYKGLYTQAVDQAAGLRLELVGLQNMVEELKNGTIVFKTRAENHESQLAGLQKEVKRLEASLKEQKEESKSNIFEKQRVIETLSTELRRLRGTHEEVLQKVAEQAIAHGKQIERSAKESDKLREALNKRALPSNANSEYAASQHPDDDMQSVASTVIRNRETFDGRILTKVQKDAMRIFLNDLLEREKREQDALLMVAGNDEVEEDV